MGSDNFKVIFYEFVSNKYHDNVHASLIYLHKTKWMMDFVFARMTQRSFWFNINLCKLTWVQQQKSPQEASYSKVNTEQ